MGINNSYFTVGGDIEYWGSTWPSLTDVCLGLGPDCDNEFIGTRYRSVAAGDDSEDIYYVAYDMLKEILLSHVDNATTQTSVNKIVMEDDVEEFYANWVENGGSDRSGLANENDDVDEYKENMM